MDETIFATISLAIVSLWLLYRYLMQPYSYWKKLGIASPPTVPIFGSMASIFSEYTHIGDLERYRKYGRIYGIYEMRKPALIVGDMKLLRDVMVKDFQVFPGSRVFPATDPVSGNMLFLSHGEKWKRLRMIMSPVFASGKIKKMYSIIMDSAKTTATNFLDAAKKKEQIDLKKYFGAFTIDVIAGSAFGTKIDSHNDPQNAFVKNAALAFTSAWRFILAALIPRIFKLLGICIFNPSSLDFFKEATFKIIDERRRTGNRRNDFLQMLMEAEYKEDDATDFEERDNVIETKEINNQSTNLNNEAVYTKNKVFHNKKLNRDELVAQCVLFFVAGYETSSTTLAFVGHNLAVFPEWQEKVIQEVDECLKENPEGLTYDAVMQMKCLDMVVCETLRMYPPAIATERMATSDYKLGDTGITVPKGMVVHIPIYPIHNDPEYYPDPEKFDPNRFSVEEKSKRDPLTFLPFGAGPRNCIAMRFALVEIKTCIAVALSQIRFKRSSKTKVPIDMKRGQGFLLPKDVTVEVEERTDKVIFADHH